MFKGKVTKRPFLSGSHQRDGSGHRSIENSLGRDPLTVWICGSLDVSTSHSKPNTKNTHTHEINTAAKAKGKHKCCISTVRFFLLNLHKTQSDINAHKRLP